MERVFVQAKYLVGNGKAPTKFLDALASLESVMTVSQSGGTGFFVRYQINGLLTLNLKTINQSISNELTN